MKKFTRTTVSRLLIGDRFYKASDTTKKVLERVPGHIVQTKFQTYGFWCKADGDKESKALNKKTPVVFLRHKENKN